ncbi:hypothetical protein L9F34_003551 [Klebsiella aerogenes]|uniref:hypothetical protein n=1 Tax=Klebsiella TaxID=570 RepID=UPI001156E64D|nr:hypothetical protein [Klebsiella pneumoniae]EKV3393666.1 hypothetical protein [Klebsiella aerogenes]ELH4141959.1 hypothetical protein [Klebsiella pneumoniae]MBF7745995.1 hypothetical protein [Klebsiella pneumoniae]MBF7761833.1 hypothetical protein [Klebsiella pneumoniae]MBF7767527.1 hypothetical protein [Klebsiella pneumoniae]
MDLQELRLIEASAINITFKQNSLVKGKGSIKVDYGTVEFEAGGHLVDKPEAGVLAMRASPCIRGFQGDQEHIDGKEEFFLQIEIRLVFVFDSKSEMSQDFILENSWYFSSFIRTFFKNFADDILKNTTLNGIKLQLN